MLKSFESEHVYNIINNIVLVGKATFSVDWITYDEDKN